MDDVLGYAGRRVIAFGAASPIGTATIKILVDLGAEVHAIDLEKPDQPGLASFTEIDPRDAAQVEAAVRKIGRVVNALFDCAVVSNDEDFTQLRHLTEHIVPLMIDGAAIVSVVSVTDGESPTVRVMNDYTAERTPALSRSGIRMNSVHARLTEPAAEHAWPLVLLNSPRAS